MVMVSVNGIDLRLVFGRTWCFILRASSVPFAWLKIFVIDIVERFPLSRLVLLLIAIPCLAKRRAKHLGLVIPFV